MMVTYHLRMNPSKEVLHIDAQSAADAVQQAIMDKPGERVVECWSGGIVNPKAPEQVGKIKYDDIPPHEPLTKEQVAELKKKRRRKKEDHTMGIDFGDFDVAAESKKAVNRRDV